ncbi:hypothetical protein EXIGLDRAFT_206453 [Exidia glandulosa HHB12029]|uniref:Uncharacterized protein n=1 Tax=Exidia glandulosa HHB12029 TaxID=1314781 RepID=A0A165MWE6_EXIGL|nr:hypothetical protein EXIGLDRAFT_206453 [Exidia glandulosa HHB12029]
MKMCPSPSRARMQQSARPRPACAPSLPRTTSHQAKAGSQVRATPLLRARVDANDLCQLLRAGLHRARSPSLLDLVSRKTTKLQIPPRRPPPNCLTSWCLSSTAGRRARSVARISEPSLGRAAPLACPASHAAETTSSATGRTGSCSAGCSRAGGWSATALRTRKHSIL